jgi:hypothetical protein
MTALGREVWRKNTLKDLPSPWEKAVGINFYVQRVIWY